MGGASVPVMSQKEPIISTFSMGGGWLKTQYKRWIFTSAKAPSPLTSQNHYYILTDSFDSVLTEFCYMQSIPCRIWFGGNNIISLLCPLAGFLADVK